MKGIKSYNKFITAICISCLTVNVNGQQANPCKSGGHTCYFGVEMNDVLCGHSADTYCKGIQNGKEVRFEYSEVTLKMPALGENLDAGFRWNYVLDPATRRAIEIMVNVINGESDRILYQLNELGSGITS